MKTKAIVPESEIKKPKNFNKNQMNERVKKNKKEPKLMQNNERNFKSFDENE